MALISPGSMISDIRGSVGQVTYLRTPAGLVARERTIPTQTPSAERDLCNAAWTNLLLMWSDVLTETHRQKWRQRGVEFPRPNKLGQVHRSSGISCFVRANYMYYLTYGVINTLVPLRYPDVPQPVIDTDYLSVTADPPECYADMLFPDPPWLDYATLLVVQTGRPVPAGRQYYNGPWCFADYNYYSVIGNWDIYDWHIPLNTAGHAGDVIWLRWRQSSDLYASTSSPWTIRLPIT